MAPEKRVLQLIDADDEDNGADVRELRSLFDALAPIQPSELLGDWSGGDFHGYGEKATHPLHAMLETYRWAGMLVESFEDAKPVMTWTDEGMRVENEYWGRAVIRELKMRDVLSACCIFDRWPIFYHFRRVSDSTIMGMTEFKDDAMKQAGDYYFWIRK
ncbi:hypothetical protein B0J12DRAFT_774349 [Macrophomina phaseolina]|uniref:DUF4334 domain-containing protein n=1 Tax=Macrophomina phaseolina TaxID=35725 RepID=A0ABQ8GI27_9PEZI|nr:hypothetical protein B0J12DRAFT_774349 [Macrophomina phaseolina]